MYVLMGKWLKKGFCFTNKMFAERLCYYYVFLQEWLLEEYCANVLLGARFVPQRIKFYDA